MLEFRVIFTDALNFGMWNCETVADTCTRKDCQPQPNFLPEGPVQKKDLTPMPLLEGKDYGNYYHTDSLGKHA